MLLLGIYFTMILKKSLLFKFRHVYQLIAYEIYLKILTNFNVAVTSTKGGKMAIMGNRKEFAAKFADVLNIALVKKYKKVPSGHFMANQFNLRAEGTTTITAETARKWVKGLSVPEIDRFKVLIKWLELDVDDLFNTKAVHLNPKENNDVIDAIETKIHDLVEMISKFKDEKKK
jgi:hypothetical protein